MPYADYGGFGQDYFEGGNVSDPHPAGYTYYDESYLPFDQYAKVIRDELQSNGIDPSDAKVLVLGCAYGHTVDWLVNQYNVDAYGMDISTWAVNNGNSAVSDRIYEGNATLRTDIESVENSTGGRFDVIFTECLLTCLTDTEAQDAADAARKRAMQAVVHRVWATDKADLNTSWYNAKTFSEWQSLVDNAGKDYWYGTDYFNQ